MGAVLRPVCRVDSLRLMARFLAFLRAQLFCVIFAAVVGAGAEESADASGVRADAEFWGVFTQTTGVRDLDVEYGEIRTILEKNPHISGIVIRVRWSQLNPAEGEFVFDKLERLIALIADHRCKVVLSVFPGAGTPKWVFEKGTPRFTEINRNRGFFQFGQEMNCPVPWDPTYMAAWERMVAELGRRYDRDARVFAVGVFGHNYREIEMYMPNGEATMKRWVEEFGWTPAKVEANWKHWIDFFGEQFPTQRFVLVLSDLYRDPETNKVRDELARYAAAKFPGRVIAEHHGLHGNVDQRENPNVRAMFAAKEDLLGTGVELVASYYDNPEGNRYGPGSIEMNILNTKYLPRLRIIHIWERDAANPEFSRLLLAAHEKYAALSADEMRTLLQSDGRYVTMAKPMREFDEQTKVIREKYKGDSKTMLSELNRLNREWAKSIGQEKLLEKSQQDDQRLFAKYYPPGVMTRYFGLVADVGGGGQARYFDMAAWQQAMHVSENEVTLSFFVDRKRYKGVVPTSLTVQLRTRGKSDKEEYGLSEGQNLPGTFRAQLATSKNADGVYSTKFAVPAAAKDAYLVQIDAEIEPGWVARAVVNLKNIELPAATK